MQTEDERELRMQILQGKPKEEGVKSKKDESKKSKTGNQSQKQKQQQRQANNNPNANRPPKPVEQVHQVRQFVKDRVIIQ